MRFAILTFVSTLFVSQIALAQSPWRWKFSPGDVLQYDVQQQSRSETKGAGKPTSATINMSMRVAWKVDSVDEQGAITVNQTIDRLSATLQVEKLEPITYDSAAQSVPTGPAKDISDSVKPILGVAIKVQMSPRGEVLSVEPSSGIRESLGKAKADQWFSPDGLVRVIQQASFVVPEQAVEPGASWEATSDLSSPLGQLQQTTRYTYTGKADRGGKSVEKIDSVTQFKLKESKKGPTQTAIQDSEQQGTIWFDSAAGRLVGSEIKQRLVTERPYREMTIRVVSTTTATTTLVE